MEVDNTAQVLAEFYGKRGCIIFEYYPYNYLRSKWQVLYKPEDRSHVRSELLDEAAGWAYYRSKYSELKRLDKNCEMDWPWT